MGCEERGTVEGIGRERCGDGEECGAEIVTDSRS
jgi:hypothetical protein